MQSRQRSSGWIIRSAVVVFTAAVLGSAVPGAAAAQVRPDSSRAHPTARGQVTPPASDTTVQSQMAWMVPYMEQLSHAAMQSLLATLARRETAERLATFTKNYYDALVAKGFTKDEALRIVIGQGIPMTPSPVGR